MIAYDLDGDGKLGIVAGPYWLENLGDGQFRPHLLIDPGHSQSANLHAICRIAIADIDGNGRPTFSLRWRTSTITFIRPSLTRGLVREYRKPTG